MTTKTPIASLRFLGAARTVTGSRFLIESNGESVLVDCGMFQGLKTDRVRNWEPFPHPAASIGRVVLTHAHIDHSGFLPRLVREGFRGPVYCTPETAELVTILLRDSARLQEEQAAYANRVRATRHHPALPLYTSADAEAACELLRPTPFNTPVEIGPELTVELRPAGHILGSASVLVTSGSSDEARRVLFSGDLGRSSHPLLLPPVPPPAADVIVVESTYGNRSHPSADDEMARFGEVITDTAARGGTVVIPAFAVDRTEVVLHALRTLEERGEIPELPIYVDSPMALAVLEVYRDAIERGAPDLRPGLSGSAGFDRTRITECHSTEESKRLAEVSYPSIIISASGMATGGRVLHHLARLLPDRRNSVVLTGFQAAGTRGQRLQQGERAVKIFGHYVPVRADVTVLDAFSVHADGEELIEWLGSAPSAPDCCYVVHGEQRASEALAARIDDELGWLAVVPHHLEQVSLRA